jgi:hypothetical protein
VVREGLRQFRLAVAAPSPTSAPKEEDEYKEFSGDNNHSGDCTYIGNYSTFSR